MDIGPVLPPHLRKNSGTSDSDQSDQGEDFGPVIPEHLGKNPGKSFEKDSKEFKAKEPTERKKSQSFSSEQISVGPQLPPHLQERLCSDNEGENSEESEEDDCYGPALPPGFKTNSDHKKERTLFPGPALPPHMTEEGYYFVGFRSSSYSSSYTFFLFTLRIIGESNSVKVKFSKCSLFVAVAQYIALHINLFLL